MAVVGVILGCGGRAPVGGVAAASVPAHAACLHACQHLIDRCTRVFGPAMGDMRPFCTDAVLRRCEANGVETCAVVDEPPR